MTNSLQLLSNALNEKPSLALSFYSFGAVMTQRKGEAICEYAVDPTQIAQALSAKVVFDTGILSENTILLRQEGVKKTIVEYRPAQKTGLFVEGSETAIRIPLPPLVLIRTSQQQQPDYQFFAVKQRPTLTSELFVAPFPNVNSHGSICWGTVRQVHDQASSAALTHDWAVLLGSPFGDHSCSSKSKKFPRDIRRQWMALEQRKARRYPVSDLVSAKTTLAQVLGEKA